MNRPFSRAITDVLAERQRQVDVEGWTSDHDDDQDNCQLARAADCYVDFYCSPQKPMDQDGVPNDWPWEASWWKPKDPRRDLVRAAALLVAEIERLDRISTP